MKRAPLIRKSPLRARSPWRPERRPLPRGVQAQLSPAGVVRLVPATPAGRVCCAGVVELSLAAAAGDPVAVEQLTVLAGLLEHRVAQDRVVAVASHREGEDGTVAGSSAATTPNVLGVAA